MMKKNVLVISTSLRQQSNSDALAEAFMRGAEEAGHEVKKISLRGKDIRFCRGCLSCQNTGQCVIKDDMISITLARSSLGRNIDKYEFFSYSSNEALHLAAGEIDIFRSVLDMISQELHRSIDKHSRDLIVSNIELLLNYCLRFYDRQFVTREEINHDVVRRFERMLTDYIQTQASREGLPTVAYFADKCCLSTGYFGTLVKVETGRTAKDFIADRLLTAAKQLLDDSSLSVNEVGMQLGFEYSQHFVRFFKAHTGMTPTQYRVAL